MVAGVARFKMNPLVRYLIDSHPTVDMNELNHISASDDDRWQFEWSQYRWDDGA